MKVAVVSDIHDNLVNLNKFLDWSKENKIDKLLCLGDVTNSETLEVITQKFKKEIFFVRGNMEIYEEKELEKYDNINNGSRVAVFKFNNVEVGACHEPFLINKVLELGDPKTVFYGHTHKPWIENKDGVRLLNPGTLGGVFSRASFAVWDVEADKLELKILDII